MTNTARARLFVGIVAGILLLIGGIGLVSAVSSTGFTGKVACGSAIAPNDKQARHDGDVDALADAMAGKPVTSLSTYANKNLAACEDALGGQRAWTWPLFGLGLVGLLGMFFIRSTTNASPPPTPAG